MTFTAEPDAPASGSGLSGPDRLDRDAFPMRPRWLTGDWLPVLESGRLPELEALRREHLAVLDAWARAEAALASLAAGFVAEDRCARDDVDRAVREGVDPAAPELTPELVRGARRRVAAEHADEALLAVCHFVRRTVERLCGPLLEGLFYVSSATRRQGSDRGELRDGEAVGLLLSRLDMGVGSNVLDEIADVAASARSGGRR